jgi:hypothetical protein
VVEHSDRQGTTAPAVFAQAGGWTEVADHKDLADRDRFVTARWTGRMTTYDVREGAEPTAGVDAAVSALRRGELAVLPTDTVYGIAADAFSPPAVGRLLEAKGRGRDMPVPVLVGSWRPSTASPSW